MRLSARPTSDPADYAFSHRVRVRFAETDAMGVAHHGSFLLYLEETRVDFLAHLGHPYSSIRLEGLDLPVLEVWVKYRRPLRFDDRVDVHVAMAGATRTSFEVAYLLERDGVEVATAVTVHGATDHQGKPQRLPPWLADAAATQCLRTGAPSR